MSDDSLVGKTIYCRCYYDDELSAGEWSIVSGNQYATINENGKMEIVSGTQNKDVTVQCRCNGMTAQRTFTVSYDNNQLAIKGPDTITGTDGNVIFTWNDEFLPPTEVQFSITSGGNIASIDENATISISGDGDIVVQATYNGVTTSRTISVQYNANSHS